jgi:dihydrofolate reductase
LSSDVAVDELYITTLDVSLGESINTPVHFKHTSDVWEHVETLGNGTKDENNTYDWKIDRLSRVLNVIEI